MTDEITALGPSNVTFLQKLKVSGNSAVFKVAVHGRTCVMKVVSEIFLITDTFAKCFKYHDRGSSDCDPPDHKVNLFVCESTVYQWMKVKGLCKQGIVSDFYEMIKNIQSILWPDLNMFLEDKLPPNTILIEYILNMEPIELFNFSKHYLKQLHHILYDIHKTGVLHGDPKSRNMMISREEENKVLWIDFDSAQTFSEDLLSPQQETWVKEEVEMMDFFVEALVGFSHLFHNFD